MKLGPSNSIRSRVISETIDGLFRNHQQPNGIKLLNFLAATHNWCWFSRDKNVARNLTFGYAAQSLSIAVTSAWPTASPASHNLGLTARRTPTIIVSVKLCSSAA